MCEIIEIKIAECAISIHEVKDTSFIFAIIFPSNTIEKINNNLDKNDNKFSFSEWISIIQTKKIDRSNRKNNTELVDLFLENKPSISKNSKQKFYKANENAKKIF